LSGNLRELLIPQRSGRQIQTRRRVRSGRAARGVLQLRRNLAHPVQHLEVAVDQGVHADGKHPRARPKGTDAAERRRHGPVDGRKLWHRLRPRRTALPSQ
jgi:hypothetical protein